MSIIRKTIVGILSAIGGAGIVFAAFKYSTLNWIVDGPGWIVSRFVSVDFHEGDGAFGFLLSLLISWICASLAVFYCARGIEKAVKRRKA